MRINCHVPITLRIVGTPTDEQLAAVGAALTRIVSARLAEAERLLADRHGEHQGVAAPTREPYDPARHAARGYAVPSYQDHGNPTSVPTGTNPPAPPPVGPDPRDPSNPKNTLTAREGFDHWMRYWTVRHNRAVQREKEVRRGIWRRDVLAFDRMARRFKLGRRDALGPDYEAAANELDFCQMITSTARDLLSWFEAQEKNGSPVTFDQANQFAVRIAHGYALYQTWMEPLVFAALGSLGRPTVRWEPAERPPPAASPRPPGGGPVRRAVRNLTARAMIGLAEGEAATRPSTGSSPAVVQRRPAATTPTPAPAVTVTSVPAVTPDPAPTPAVTVTSVPAVTPTSAPATTATPAIVARAEVSRADDAAFAQIWDLNPSDTTISPGQGVVSVAPEVAAGVTPAQRQVLAETLGQPFTAPATSVLATEWNAAARAGDAAILTAGNSRYLFGLHRNRFWRRVAASPVAAAALRRAGFVVDGGAPYLILNGQRVTLTIDHIIERQTAPQLTLTAANLRLSLSRENSVVLRLLNDLDPFQ